MKKILLVKLSSLGDVIHALPVLSALKGAFPEARIDWVVEEAASEILKGHPLLHRVVVWQRKRLFAGLKRIERNSLQGWKAFLKELRQESYDLIIDLQGLFKSGVLVGLARGRCKLGFANHREGSTFFYNLKMPPYDPDEHAVKRYLKVLSLLGLNSPEVSFPLPSLPEFRPLKEKFGLPARFAVFIPRARWSTKLWHVRGWQSLAQKFEEEGILPVFVGAQADRDYVKTILSEAPGLSLCGKTGLLELASLLKEASFIVSVDTGPLHLAAALGKKTVALFGPTAPWRTGPYGDGHRVIFKGLSCSPCFKKSCLKRRCLKEITPEEVFEVCEF